MRYCVFSDVHSNLEAFEAILDVARKSHIDRYVFLGDIVGYGADPKECIALLRSLDALMIAGNHDWASADKLPLDYFNEAARLAILWTKGVLSSAEKLFLSELSIVLEAEQFCLAHGTLDHPQEFNYMTDGPGAVKTFYMLKQQICFVGHSHQPGVFVDDGNTMTYQGQENFKIREGLRYIVNDGSVGQPRDGDNRACFCVYDEEGRTIEFRRVAYDVACAQKKIRDVGLPAVLADRLSAGR